MHALCCRVWGRPGTRPSPSQAARRSGHRHRTSTGIMGGASLCPLLVPLNPAVSASACSPSGDRDSPVVVGPDRLGFPAILGGIADPMLPVGFQASSSPAGFSASGGTEEKVAVLAARCITTEEEMR